MAALRQEFPGVGNSAYTETEAWGCPLQVK
jgi:hypothetical protein